MVDDIDKLQEAQKYLKKELKINISFADEEAYGIKRVKTGMPMFDYILGGGFPRGAVTLLHGEESSGKTFVTQKAIAHAQSEGLVCAFIDVEHAYSQEWSNKIGIDNSRLLINMPLTAEEALETAVSLCNSGFVDLLVLDSLAALVPADESSSSMTEYQIGLQARLIGKFLRSVCASNTNTALILINQHRVDLMGRAFQGQMPYLLPGGKSQRYFAKIRVELKRGGYLYNKGEKNKKGSVPTGFVIRAKTQKNKTNVPMLSCEIPVYFTGDIDFIEEIFDLGCMYGIIKRGGAYYSYGDIRVMGKDNFKKELSDDDFRAKIENDIEEYIDERGYVISEVENE